MSMKRWMTLSEIAQAGLPGLPGSARGVAKRAQAEGWTKRTGIVRKRKGRGGGLEFSIEVLPEEARTELMRRAVAPAKPTEAISLREDDPLSGAERARRDSRLFVLGALEEFRKANGLGVKDGAVLFSDAWSGGLIEAPEFVRDYISSCCTKSLFNWRAIRRKHGDDALGIDRRGRPAAITKAAEGEAEEAMLAAIAKQEFLSAEQLGAYLRDRFGDEVSEISERTIQRHRARLEERHRNVLMALRNPDRYRSAVEFSATNSTFAAGLNDLWQIDASPADVMLKGKRRHSIYMAIDIWSRRTKILVTQTPRAAAVAMLLRSCILDWGVPRVVKTDNGSDFKANAIARLLAALGIEHEVSKPYDPKSKGNVERVIGTFQRDLATCPGFIGHSVADRKVIEGRKAFSRRLGMDDHELFDVQMDLPEFQTWCEDWTSTIYAHREHSALKMSPFAKAASWTGEIRRLSQPRALDMLLAPVPGKDGVRRVTKQGLKIDGEYYQTSAAWPGEDVLVRMDPADLGRALVFALDGESYLGEAICPHLAGEDPVAIAMQVKAAQKAHMQEETARVRKEMKKIRPRDFSDAMLRDGERRAANLTYLERPAVPFSTPALDAAAQAAADNAPKPTEYDPEKIRDQLAEVVKIPRPRRVRQVQEDPHDQFRRAVDLEEAMKRGDDVSEADAAWLRSYQKHPDYLGAMRIYRVHGRKMFG
ncbi:integrase [Rhodovulum phage RS1]|uniref:transposase n=1 Tax=Rhodobacter phage RC1 TaxID=754055 RepID=UPI0002C1866B|nr:transposase [Rhodobacter phage RC1]YP_007676387.1 transposase [Rhodovulum phage RS1]AGH57973.1 integrase [Rhodovulum phage RS1]AGH58069.1 integrase [Rhodobacter phage RC1]